MVTESLKSFVAGIYEKFTSPLAGAFVGAWLVINWKLVSYYLFSNDPMLVKIDFISEFYICLWDNLYKPLISTFVILVVYPPTSVAAFLIWEYFQSIKTNIRYRLSKNVLLPIAESKKIKEDMKELEQRHYAETKQYEDKLEEMNSAMYELRSEISDKQKKLAAEKKELESQMVNAGGLAEVESDSVLKHTEKPIMPWDIGGDFDAELFLKNIGEEIDNGIDNMDAGQSYTLTGIIGKDLYNTIPRTERKIINDTFFDMVKDMYFTGIEYFSEDSSGVNSYVKKNN